MRSVREAACRGLEKDGKIKIVPSMYHSAGDGRFLA